MPPGLSTAVRGTIKGTAAGAQTSRPADAGPVKLCLTGRIHRPLLFCNVGRMGNSSRRIADPFCIKRKSRARALERYCHFTIPSDSIFSADFTFSSTSAKSFLKSSRCLDGYFLGDCGRPVRGAVRSLSSRTSAHSRLQASRSSVGNFSISFGSRTDARSSSLSHQAIRLWTTARSANFRIVASSAVRKSRACLR